MVETTAVRRGTSDCRIHQWGTPHDTPPLVMLHGFTGDGLDWAPLVDHLGPRHLIAPDLLGHGASSAPDDPSLYSIDAQVCLIESILEEMRINTFDLIGYSMGGRIALSMATRSAPRIRKLVVVSSTAGIEDESERAARREEDEERAHRILTEGVEPFLRTWQRHPIIASQRRIDARWRDPMQRRRRTRSAVGLAMSLMGAGTGTMTPLWAHLSHIELPTLVLSGEEDTKYVAVGERMVKALPDARHEVIERAGHTAHLERPAVVGALIRTHLDMPSRHTL